MKGCYCLIIHVKRKSKIRVGAKLGDVEFKKGIYVYVGSAMNSLESRLNRHLSDSKKLHWHVDYLLKDDNSKIIDIIYNTDKKVECDISQYIETKTIGIENFGCSDCNCKSHLYYFKNRSEAIEQVQNAYDSIATEFMFFKI